MQPDSICEWICADHWRLVPRRIKRLRRLAVRRHKHWLVMLLWQRAKRHAIEAAAGI